jgi:hypothetical protein
MNRRCIEDKKQYEKGIKIKSDELENVTIEQDAFHPEWNYTIKNIGNVICARLLSGSSARNAENSDEFAEHCGGQIIKRLEKENFEQEHGVARTTPALRTRLGSAVLMSGRNTFPNQSLRQAA